MGVVWDIQIAPVAADELSTSDFGRKMVVRRVQMALGHVLKDEFMLGGQGPVNTVAMRVAIGRDEHVRQTQEEGCHGESGGQSCGGGGGVGMPEVGALGGAVEALGTSSPLPSMNSEWPSFDFGLLSGTQCAGTRTLERETVGTRSGTKHVEAGVNWATG